MEYEGLILALGNPGARYAGTRHNCGFMFADELLAEARETGFGEELNGKKFNSLLWRLKTPELRAPWLLAKPQTFMNASGEAAAPLLRWFKLPPSRLLVIQDELDIPAGQLRFKFGGGLAGHNGLASIAEKIGSKDFYRLRIGVGKPTHKSAILDWVLTKPAGEDTEKIREAVSLAVETFFVFADKGAGAAAAFARSANSPT